MRPDELRIGGTYRVHIPRRNSPAKHLTHDSDRSDVDIALAQLALSRATAFDLTITSLDVEPLGEAPAVTGVRVVDTAHIRTPLAPDIAAALGLPADVEYVVEGVLKDAASDDLVRLLTEQTVTVLARWLRRLPARPVMREAWSGPLPGRSPPATAPGATLRNPDCGN